MTMLFGTESQGPGSVGVGRVSVGRVTAFECSCWSSVGGLCWADVSQEEQLSQTAERARSWEGRSLVLVWTLTGPRVSELEGQGG